VVSSGSTGVAEPTNARDMAQDYGARQSLRSCWRRSAKRRTRRSTADSGAGAPLQPRHRDWQCCSAVASAALPFRGLGLAWSAADSASRWPRTLQTPYCTEASMTQLGLRQGATHSPCSSRSSSEHQHRNALKPANPARRNLFPKESFQIPQKPAAAFVESFYGAGSRHTFAGASRPSASQPPIALVCRLARKAPAPLCVQHFCIRSRRANAAGTVSHMGCTCGPSAAP